MISSVEGSQGLIEQQKTLRSKDPWCPQEYTGSLFWPGTSIDTDRTLRCPNSNVMITRTCSPSGVWGNVDPSLCIPFSDIDVVSINVTCRIYLMSSMLYIHVYMCIYMVHMMYMIHPYMQNNITLDNFDEVLRSLSGAVRGGATNVSEQTTSNLAITTAVFMTTSELINTTTIIQDEVCSLLSCFFVCNN